MGGEIGVESELGRGSQFSFTAQFGQAEGKTDGVPWRCPRNSGLRILVVDERELTRGLLKEQIERWGAKVTIAGDVMAGLDSTRAYAEGGGLFALALVIRTDRLTERLCSYCEIPCFAAPARPPELSDPPEPGSEGPRYLVLVAEDNLVNQRVAIATLEKAG